MGAELCAGGGDGEDGVVPRAVLAELAAILEYGPAGLAGAAAATLGALALTAA